MFTVFVRFYRYFKALITSPLMSEGELKSLVAALPVEERKKFLKHSAVRERQIKEAKRVRDEYNRML